MLAPETSTSLSRAFLTSSIETPSSSDSSSDDNLNQEIILGVFEHLNDLLVTKLFSRFLPLRSDGEVVHGEGRISSHILLDLEEGRKSLGNLVILESGAGLQEDESLAPSMAGRVVDVELIMLTFIQK